MLNANEKTREKFAISHTNRLFEVDLYWKRALFFWGFIASAFVAFATLHSTGSGYSIVIACFGVICSLIWSLGNRGGKYWQEYWEEKVEEVEDEITGPIFIDNEPGNRKTKFSWLASQKFSVSKLAIALSDYVCILWLLIVLQQVIYILWIFDNRTKNIFIGAFVIFTAIYGILVIVQCRSGKEKAKLFSERHSRM